jgi:predicted dehydrogenase
MRVGIVGIGWWSDVLAKVVARTDKLELRAGYSRSADKTARFAVEFGCEAMPSYEAMLACEDIDAVILTTPNSAHRSGTEAAAAAGKHVFVEKPISNAIADGKAMIAACDAAGAIGYVGSDYISPRHFTLALHGTKGNAFFDLDRDEIRVQRTG